MFLQINTTILIFYCAFVLIVLLNYNYHTDFIPAKGSSIKITSRCQVPLYVSNAPNISTVFERKAYNECLSYNAITSILYDQTDGNAYLIVEPKIKLSEWFNLTCDYHEIVQAHQRNYVLETYMYLQQRNENRFIEIKKIKKSAEFISVQCKLHGKVIYNNVHSVAHDIPDIREKLKKKLKNRNVKVPKLNVLLLSFNSISRMNFIQLLPITTNYLKNNEWFELRGYNKITQNTFTNLMAIITGLTSLTCKSQSLSDCPFLWKPLKEAGYITAYGEGDVLLPTFNNLKSIFDNKYLDFNIHPYINMVEYNFLNISDKSIPICLGYKRSIDHIYQYALDLATIYRNDQFVGLFTTNIFENGDYGSASMLDVQLKDYFREMKKRRILKNTVVILFSTQGMTYAKNMTTDFLEQRSSPFVFISIPKWFKKKYPKKIESLKINQNRLTSPYDLYATLQEILMITENIPKKNASILNCSNCQSLFYEIPFNRSCTSAAIPPQFCSCID